MDRGETARPTPRNAPQLGKEFFALASKLGLEGIVAKDKRSHYVSGRQSREWQRG